MGSKLTVYIVAGGYDAPGMQQRYGSEIVEEENEKMADVLSDKVKALKSVSCNQTIVTCQIFSLVHVVFFYRYQIALC